MAPFPIVDFVLLLANSPVAGGLRGYMIGMLIGEWARRSGPPRLGNF